MKHPKLMHIIEIGLTQGELLHGNTKKINYFLKEFKGDCKPNEKLKMKCVLF